MRSRGRVYASLIVPCGLSLALLAGCGSFSESSKSSSQIVSSPITSLSASSSPENAYREDVRGYVAAYYKSSGDPKQLRRRIGELAAKHGISDWESDENTFRGIGQGLADAGAKQVEVDAFKDGLGASENQAGWIQQGYDSAR
jgi:hypothetical protein